MLNLLRKRFAVYIFHDDAGPSLILDEIIECGDVLMMQSSLDARFIQEPVEEIGILTCLGQDLDRYNPIDLGVHRSVDFAHSSGTQEVDNAILADAGINMDGVHASSDPLQLDVLRSAAVPDPAGR
jgi:hypothetical protein